MRRSGAFLGPVLIVVGLLMLLGQMGIPAFQHLWPLFLLVPGIALLFRWFSARGDSGMVFSGTLLVLLGLLFQADQWFGLDFGDHWPFFPLAVGLAFVARGAVDREARDSFTPGGILIAVGVVFYFFSSGLFSWLVDFFVDLIRVVVRVAVPLGLIGWGAWLLFVRKPETAAPTAFPEKVEPKPTPQPEPTPKAEHVAVPPPPPDRPGVVDAEFDEDDEYGPTGPGA